MCTNHIYYFTRLLFYLATFSRNITKIAFFFLYIFYDLAINAHGHYFTLRLNSPDSCPESASQLQIHHQFFLHNFDQPWSPK